MRLHVSVELIADVPHSAGRDGSACDVVVSVHEAHCCGEVLAALAAHVGCPVESHWLLARPATGEVFDSSESFIGTGVANGARLVIGAPDAVDRVVPPSPNRPGGPADQQLSVVVCSGPDIGQELPLRAGHELVVGRDPMTDLRLSDPAVGRADLVLSFEAAGGASRAEDPTGSDDQLVEMFPAPGVVITVDGRAVNGNGQAPPVAKAGSRIGVGGSLLVLGPSRPPTRLGSFAERDGQIPLTPSIDRTTPVSEVIIEAATDLPQALEPPSFAFIGALAPLAMGVALALLYSPRFLLFAALSPLVAVGGWVDQWRRNRKRRARDLERLEADLTRTRQRCERALDRERMLRWRRAPDVPELIERAVMRSAELWNRDRHASDALQVRLGIGNVASALRIELPTHGDPELVALVAERLDGFDVLAEVPVTVDLGLHPVVALTGPAAMQDHMLRTILVHLSGNHSPRQVVIACAIDPRRACEEWAKWLPHLRWSASQTTGPAGIDALLAAVLDAAHRRAPPAGGGSVPGPTVWPRIVCVVDEALGPDPALVDRLCRSGPALGVSVILLAEGAARLPAPTSAVVDCRSPVEGRPTSLALATESGWDEITFRPDSVGAAVARTHACLLAPLRDASMEVGEGALAETVSLLEAFGADGSSGVDAEWVAARWRRPRDGTLATPLGCTTTGPFAVDLALHGPHTLVGGTSGSGKSELILALVAGLVAHHPPQHLNVLFVDYKGGATGEVFSSIPHTVGCVTNLDAAMAGRVLTSLRAELNRRMALLRGRAKDLQQLVELVPNEAPPALVIVIDEFATLVSEVPDFMDGVVDIAQRGRSLGIHLVLATQRPAVAVNDNILANTNLRLCLRTVDGSESTAVIATPDAAMIPPEVKGRGLVRLGPADPTLFQTAWAGAPAPQKDLSEPVRVWAFRRRSDLDAPPVTATLPSVVEPAGLTPPTQLHQVLEAVTEAAAQCGAGEIRRPWLDELPTHIELNTLVTASALDNQRHDRTGSTSSGFALTLGMVDDPAAQAQYPLALDIGAGGGLMVFGAGGSGRTNVLRTAAAAAADTATSRLAPLVFALDFASHELTGLAELPHCALVATGDDLEAVTRVISVLRAEIDRRKRRRVVRPIVLLIDDYGAAMEVFEGAGAPSGLYVWAERLQRVITEGTGVGVHTILTATRRGVIRASVWSALGHRLVLRCVDPAAALELGVAPAVASSLVDVPPGRGYLQGSTLVQIAVAPSSGATACTVEEPACRATPVSATHPPWLAPQPIPPELNLGPLPEVVQAFPAGGDPLTVRLAQPDLRMEPLEVHLEADDLTIVGPPGSGRSSTLLTVAHQLASGGVAVWGCGPERSPVGRSSSLHRWLAFPPVGAGEVMAGLAALVAELDDRRTAREVVLLVDDLDEFDDPALTEVAHQLVQRRIRLVAAAGSVRGYAPNPLLATARKARNMVLLGPPDPHTLHEILGRPVELRPGLASVPGRAIVASSGRVELAQVAAPPALSDEVRPRRARTPTTTNPLETNHLGR